MLVIGRSKPKTHTINIKNPILSREGLEITEKFVCAEWDATRELVRKTRIPFNKVKICVLRVDNNGEIAYSRPCKSCLNLFYNFCDYREVGYSGRNGELIFL